MNHQLPLYIGIEPLSSNDRIEQFLAMCGLPVSDLSSSESLRLFGYRSGSEPLGVVGLELYPPFALLRSLAVAPEQRGGGLGRTLVAFAETQAAAQGIMSLFLLTTSAAPFFAKLGYREASRATAPASIRATAQFSGLCPSSSAFMVKHLECCENGRKKIPPPRVEGPATGEDRGEISR